MAASVTPEPGAVADRIVELAGGTPAGLIVAFSGGADSAALLHLVARGPLAARARAVHCDHGLHPESARWAARCAALAARLGIPFETARLDVDVAGGAGLEAAARAARYVALAARLGPGEALLTAHHADDQAETFLLMALRGSGVSGLAAMPAAAPLGAGLHLRPLLGFPRAALVAHARRHHLEPIEDPSNADLARDRNRIRHAVLPGLAPRWPDAAARLGRAAAWCAEADALIAEHADRDLAAAVDAAHPHRLALAPLAGFSPARERAALRRWLERLGLPAPPAAAIERIRREVMPARRDAQARVDWPGAWVAKHRDWLHAGTPLPPAPEATLVWDGRRPLALPEGGHLVLEPAAAADGEARLALDHLGRALEVRFRHGAESIRPAGHGRHRPLKKLLCEAGVLPWMRDRLPLLFADGALVAVPGLCVAEGHASPRGAAGLALVWRGHPPLR